MKNRLTSNILLLLLLTVSCGTKDKIDKPEIRLLANESERRVDILVNDQMFTSYQWPESVYKPILYPVFNSAGTEITRGFPLKPRTGEQVDHIHQVGIWLNYGNVNGLDFWGNGYRGQKEPKGGEIKHTSLDRLQSRKGEAMLVASSDWLKPDGKILLKEKTELHFTTNGTDRIIDRITKLTAQDTTVLFKDTKEGMFGIRVARQLEMPSRSGVILIDSTGNPSAVKDTMNIGVSGNYISSEGMSGENVWGTRARWMNLSGRIGDEQVSVAVCDHPDNPGYPTYWHARGYGLFSANPLGWNDFTKGKQVFNFTIPAGKSATFRYRVVISAGKSLSATELNAYADEFAKKY